MAVRRMDPGSAMMARAAALAAALALLPPHPPLEAQVTFPADAGDPIPMGTTRGESYDRLVIRGGIMISGRGTPGTSRGMPPEGPVDIVVEGGRIVDIVNADPVSLARLGEEGRPTGDRVIDADGMYVLPGIIDLHAHVAGDGGRAGPRGTEYQHRLLLGHGVTTARDPGTGAGLEYMVEQRRLSEANEIVAPRLFLYQRWPATTRTGTDPGHTPEEARALVRHYHERGADGIKVSKGPGHYPDVLQALTDEAESLGMGVAVDLKVGESDAVIASDAGVRSIEHWYGVPDAALGRSQRFPFDYNYNDELDRFRWAGDLWADADRHPDRIHAVLDHLIANGTAWNVTLVVYEANRDLFRARTLPWRDGYGHPDLLQYWEPNPEIHASYHFDWRTEDEIRWKDNFRIWGKHIREFHERGGDVTFGTDAGSLYALYGFSVIRELELLQEAGIHPFDIIKIASTNSARALGMEEDLCGIRIGCVADLAVVDGNPLQDFKVMYGGGVRWTIKEGIVFDAPALLREVRWYVEEEKRRLAEEGDADG
jgi:hypothetical protein